ncbi:MAG: pyridoxamine 5'-phosphate oxidase family protein [Chloroflexi bacterium]|nr:pyridoxamine 5'-phosphate oxidase family protein [Chloroflexota bacterium]
MSDTREIIRAFLDSQSTLALATVNAAGQAEVAPVFYVSDEALDLYWLSSETSRHSVNLTTRPAVAATVYPTAWNWNDIRGVQIEGEAQAVRDERIRERMLQGYLAKFLLPSSFDAIIAATTLYVLKPQWIRWLDNGVTFGYKTELDLS